MRLHLTFLTALAAAVALAGLAPADDRPAEGVSAEPYSMRVRMLRVDNCERVCLELFGYAPAKANSIELAVAVVESGQLGGSGGTRGVSLAGVRWAMLAQAKDDPPVGPHYVAHAFYIDSGAKPEQKDAMKKILRAPPFTELGELYGIDELPIDTFPAQGDAGEWKVRLGGLGGFTLEAVGGARGKVIAVENPIYLFPADEVVLAKAYGAFEDHGMKLELKANCGEISTFTMKGEAPAPTLPASSKKTPTPIK